MNFNSEYLDIQNSSATNTFQYIDDQIEIISENVDTCNFENLSIDLNMIESHTLTPLQPLNPAYNSLHQSEAYSDDSVSRSSLQTPLPPMSMFWDNEFFDNTNVETSVIESEFSMCEFDSSAVITEQIPILTTSMLSEELLSFNVETSSETIKDSHTHMGYIEKNTYEIQEPIITSDKTSCESLNAFDVEFDMKTKKDMWQIQDTPNSRQTSCESLNAFDVEFDMKTKKEMWQIQDTPNSRQTSCESLNAFDIEFDMKTKKEIWLRQIRETPNARPRGPKVWEFLLRLLDDQDANPSLIKFDNKQNGIFRLVKKDLISDIWSGRPCKKKSKSAPKYENFARNIRYHYKKGKVLSVAEKHLVYKFPQDVMDMFNNRHIP